MPFHDDANEIGLRNVRDTARHFSLHAVRERRMRLNNNDKDRRSKITKTTSGDHYTSSSIHTSMTLTKSECTKSPLPCFLHAFPRSERRPSLALYTVPYHTVHRPKISAGYRKRPYVDKQDATNFISHHCPHACAPPSSSVFRPLYCVPWFAVLSLAHRPNNTTVSVAA